MRPFRSKEEAGHEEPWFAFLAGDNPRYPEQMLAAAQAQARHGSPGCVRIATPTLASLTSTCGRRAPGRHRALVQLTWGGPQRLYNGDLEEASAPLLRRCWAVTRAGALRGGRWNPALSGMRQSIDLANLDPDEVLNGESAQVTSFAEHVIVTACPTACLDRFVVRKLNR